MPNKHSNEYINTCLRDYLKFANTYTGNSSKKKTSLVQMIVYGHITNTLEKNKIEDI